MIQASIDLGTNTCLLLIANVTTDSVEPIEDIAKVVRLGEGVDQTGELQPKAKERTLNALKGYKNIIEKHGCSLEDTICVATSQARDAKNGESFFKDVLSFTGLKFRVLSGAEEAKASFNGTITPPISKNEAVVIDIGGGSTEIATDEGFLSVDIGSVRFTERFFKSDPVTQDEFWDCQKEIDQIWESKHSILQKRKHLIGVAGTVTTLAQSHLGLKEFDRQSLDSCEMSRGDIHRLVEELKWRSSDERRVYLNTDPMRADVILAGALILWRYMEIFDFKSIKASTRGLRYGVFR